MSSTATATATAPTPTPTAPAATAAAPRIVVENLTVTYRPANAPPVEAVRDVTFTIDDKPGVGEVVVFLGPSGCGKSTILKAVAGLVVPDAGVVKVLGKDVEGTGRDRGMVFQQYTSFAWRTVAQNVEYGLEIQGIPAKERRERAMQMLKTVGLADFANAYPKALSGGMKQRVALARTLINEPDVVLMDEPFGALDPETRWSMQGLILDVAHQQDNTILFVTHDVAEAVYIADTIYVLSSRPARILRRVDVPFFRERSLKVRNSAEFKAVENDLLETLHNHGVAGNIRVGM